MTRRSLAWSAVAFAVISGVLAGACQESIAPQQPCRDIPEGGCPAYDNACEDPTCFTLYVCDTNDEWQVDQTCPPHEAGASVVNDAAADAAQAADSGYLNVPGALGGPGCEDLQTPDCALGVAAACSDENCCDCQDLYVCDNGGWDLWGECNGGVITQNQ